MTKAINFSWIIDFIFKLKIELFIWIYNYIMEILFLLNYIKWIQNVATLDLGFNVKKKKKKTFFKLTLLANHWPMSNKSLNPQTQDFF
jgi:hypothetical protein